MKRVKAELFVRLSRVVGEESQGIRQDLKSGKPFNINTQNVDKFYENMETLCRDTGLSVSAQKANRIVRYIRKNKIIPHTNANLFAEQVKVLSETIEDEMKSIEFFSIDKNKTYLLKPQPFGLGVDEAFPSAREDIVEASKCLAFDRGSACVFHLMKALEVSLYALAQDLKIQKIEENWGNALDQIRIAIEKFEETKPTKKTVSVEVINQWKELFSFYCDCMAHFRYIKDAWRNSNTHVRKGSALYSEEKAEQIYDNVRSFMQTMSTRIKELS